MISITLASGDEALWSAASSATLSAGNSTKNFHLVSLFRLRFFMFIPERERQAANQQLRPYRGGQNQQYAQNYGYNQQNAYNRGNFQQMEQGSRGVDVYPRAYPSAYSQASSTLNRNPLPNFQNAGIAPININVVTYDADPIPSLPRQIPNTNESSFKSRFSLVQNRVEEQNETMKLQAEAAERILNRVIPHSESEMQKLDSLLENTITSRIPAALKPLQERSTKNRENLIKMQTNIVNMLSNVEETLSKKKEELQKFKTENQTLTDKSKTDMRISKDEAKQLTHVVGLLMNEISQYEQTGADFIERISKRNDDFEQCDQTVTNSFLKMQKSLTQAIQSYYEQIAIQLRKTADSRFHSLAILHNDAETINKRGTDSLKLLKQIISTMSVSFGEELSHLHLNLSSSIADTQSTDQQLLDDLDNKLDKLIEDSSRTFSLISSEIAATISNSRGTVSHSRGTFENLLSSEKSGLESTRNYIINKTDSFRTKVSSVLANTFSRLEMNAQNIARTANSHYSALSKPIDAGINELQSAAMRIEALENEIASFEESIKTARSQVSGAVSNLSKGVEGIMTSIAEVSTNIDAGFTEIDAIVHTLEGSLSREDLCMKEDIFENEQRISKKFDDRIALLEDNLGSVLKAIADFTAAPVNQPGQKKIPAELENLIRLAKSKKDRKVKIPMDLPFDLPPLPPNIDDNQQNGHNQSNDNQQNDDNQNKDNDINQIGDENQQSDNDNQIIDEEKVDEHNTIGENVSQHEKDEQISIEDVKSEKENKNDMIVHSEE